MSAKVKEVVILDHFPSQCYRLPNGDCSCSFETFRLSELPSPEEMDSPALRAAIMREAIALIRNRYRLTDFALAALLQVPKSCLARWSKQRKIASVYQLNTVLEKLVILITEFERAGRYGKR